MHVFTDFAPLSLYPLSTCYNQYSRLLLWVHPDMAGIPSRGKKEYSQILHATESVISFCDALLRSTQCQVKPQNGLLVYKFQI